MTDDEARAIAKRVTDLATEMLELHAKLMYRGAGRDGGDVDTDVFKELAWNATHVHLKSFVHMLDGFVHSAKAECTIAPLDPCEDCGAVNPYAGALNAEFDRMDAEDAIADAKGARFMAADASQIVPKNAEEAKALLAWLAAEARAASGADPHDETEDDPENDERLN